jgi:hypothetical protein
VVAESFVDLEWFRATAYKATGWEAAGCTAQFTRVREDFYQAQLMDVEKGHGQIEWRGIAVREVTPAQMGFPPTWRRWGG